MLADRVLVQPTEIPWAALPLAVSPDSRLPDPTGTKKIPGPLLPFAWLPVIMLLLPPLGKNIPPFVPLPFARLLLTVLLPLPLKKSIPPEALPFARLLLTVLVPAPAWKDIPVSPLLH